MKKLLFASLLTSAIVLAQTGGGTTRAAEKTSTKSTTSGRKTKVDTKVRKGPKTMSDFNEASHPLEVTDKGGSAAPKTVGGCHGKHTNRRDERDEAAEQEGQQEHGRHWAVAHKNVAIRIAA